MFHQRLSALLAEKEIIPAEFARLMDKKPQTVNNWLKGHTEPDMATLLKMDALGHKRIETTLKYAHLVKMADVKKLGYKLK